MGQFYFGSKQLTKVLSPISVVADNTELLLKNRITELEYQLETKEVSFIETVKEIPVQVIQEIEKEVIKYIEVPVEKIIIQKVEIIKEVPTIIEKFIDRIVEKQVEVIKEIEKEIIKTVTPLWLFGIIGVETVLLIIMFVK